MDSSLLVLIEALVILGFVFGIGLWQLHSLRRDRRQGRDEER